MILLLAESSLYMNMCQMEISVLISQVSGAIYILYLFAHKCIVFNTRNHHSSDSGQQSEQCYKDMYKAL